MNEDLDQSTKETLDHAVSMLGETPLAREVVDYIYRYGVLDGQIRMSRRAETLLREETRS